MDTAKVDAIATLIRGLTAAERKLLQERLRPTKPEEKPEAEPERQKPRGRAILLSDDVALEQVQRDFEYLRASRGIG